MAITVSAGKNPHRFLFVLIAAAAAGLFALGVLVLSNPKQPAAAARGPLNSTDALGGGSVGPEVIVDAVREIDKPVAVTLAQSTGKLQDLFRELGYELDSVRKRGAVPRLFIASLPPDLSDLRRAEQRKVTFIKSMLPLILHANGLIEQQRRQIIALRDMTLKGRKRTPEATAWIRGIADLYGVASIDFDALLKRVDIVPPSLAIAQAAEESGWGTSRFAREGNALFGQRAYRPHQKGIVPRDREVGGKFKVRAFGQLIEAVKAYAHNLNSHFAYKEFRKLRASQRAENGGVDGYALAGSLLRYSERGEDYISTIRAIMRVNALQLLDAAKLDADDPDEVNVPDA